MLETCTVADCDRRHVARGLCGMHYQRWSRTGDPLVVRSTAPGARHPGWRGEDIGYGAAHMRVRSHRGRACTRQCLHCNKVASDWAYDHTDVAELTDPRGRAYSADPERYLPLCRSCHRSFDG